MNSSQGDPAVFDAELAAFLAWLRAFEDEASQRPGLSRWYRGPILSAYVRATRPRLPLGGETALGLADLQVAEPYRGCGFLTRALQALDAEPGLTAQHLLVENVLNAGLARRLEADGFVRRLPGDAVSPWYSRERSAWASAAAGRVPSEPA
ncbi:hypothetical protein D3C71_20550 [compost metagenome]